jgi:hypothetical protein
VPPFLDRPLRTGKPSRNGRGPRTPAAASPDQLAGPAVCARLLHSAGLAVTGARHLKHVIIDRAQLMHLAGALAAELDVTFGDDP